MALGQVDHKPVINQRPYHLHTVLPHLPLVCAMWVYIIDVHLSLYTTRNILDDVFDDCLKRGRRQRHNSKEQQVSGNPGGFDHARIDRSEAAMLAVFDDTGAIL